MSEYRRKLMLAYAANKRSDDIIYPGLIAAWSAKGKTNDDADRATLKDLTGNGHDITLNGFAFSEMSGYGGYPLSFKDTKYNKWFSKYTNTTLSFTKNNQIWRFSIKVISGSFPSMKVNIEGIKDEDNIIYNYYDGTGRICKIINLQNGEILLPESKIGNSGEISSNLLAGFSGTIVGDNTVTITLLPEYPDALVFDGVDDYGINENMPIQTDYTLIVKRKDLTSDDTSQIAPIMSKYVSKGGAFLFEGAWVKTNTWSFYKVNNGIQMPEYISYQTKTNYNGKSINAGTNDDNEHLVIGTLSKYDSRHRKFAFYSAYLFDRSLDEQEIKSFIRKYIDPNYYLPSEIVTPDCYYDFSKGSNDSETRETITDYSGNGNDAKAYNVAWSGMSGYGGYNIQSWMTYDTISIVNNSYNKVTITKKSGTFDDNPIYYNIPTNISDFTIKVNDKDAILNFIDIASTVINKGNGEWFIPKNESIKNTRLQITSSLSELTLEQTPLYEGALVLDGVDDHIKLETFDSGFKTMFMLCRCTNMFKESILYDQRKTTSINDYALY